MMIIDPVRRVNDDWFCAERTPAIRLTRTLQTGQMRGFPTGMSITFTAPQSTPDKFKALLIAFINYRRTISSTHDLVTPRRRIDSRGSYRMGNKSWKKATGIEQQSKHHYGNYSARHSGHTSSQLSRHVQLVERQL